MRRKNGTIPLTNGEETGKNPGRVYSGLGNIELPEATIIPLDLPDHFRRELLRDIARLTNPAELARRGDVQGFHLPDVELDMNVAVEAATEGEEDRPVIVRAAAGMTFFVEIRFPIFLFSCSSVSSGDRFFLISRVIT